MNYEQFYQRFVKFLQGRGGVFSVTIILLLLLCYSGWQWVKLFTTQHTQAVSVVSQSRPTGQLVQRTQISQWHLFGLYQPRIAALPKTQLRLELKGIFFDDDVKLSQALIAVPGQSGKLYHQGEAVPGGAKVHEILGDRIILDTYGKLSILPLVEPKLNILSLPKDILSQPSDAQ